MTQTCSRTRTRASKGKLKGRVVLVTPPSSEAPIYTRNPNRHLVSPAPVVPTIPMLPLGMAYIAASLEEAGFDVKIVDLTFVIQNKYNFDRVKKAILNLNPDVIGISSFTSTITSAYKLAHVMKEEIKTLPIVVGGPHVSALPQRTLEECPAIDAVVIGEGEQTFPDFLKLLFNKGISSQMANIRGVMFRYGNKLFGDPSPVYVGDLDSLPFPARHLFDQKRYIESSYYYPAKKYPVAPILTSRGCPHSCLFCSRSNSGRRFRARSPKNVILELEQLKDYGFNEVHIVDDNFVHDRQRVIEICRLMKEKRLDLSFSLVNGVRVDSVDEELLTKMYEAGCYSIYFGVESGDDTNLKTIRKGIKVEQIKKAINMAKKIGYNITVFAIIGLPGSSIESEKKTIQLIKESGVDSRISICTPYPGAPLWNLVKEHLQGIPWERYNESDISNPIYIPGYLTPDKIQLWMNEIRGNS